MKRAGLSPEQIFCSLKRPRKTRGLAMIHQGPLAILGLSLIPPAGCGYSFGSSGLTRQAKRPGPPQAGQKIWRWRRVGRTLDHTVCPAIFRQMWGL